MANSNQEPGFRIWGVDNVVYGPVDLPTLVSWIKDERVTANTWVYDDQKDHWSKASRLDVVTALFHSRNAQPAQGKITVQAGALRRVKILSDLQEDQLSEFAKFMEIKQVRQWTEIVAAGAPGNSMFLVLDGELRVRLIINERETILATLGPGEFFGEMSLFDHGPRSADVIANKDTTLVCVGVEAFARLQAERPDIATPILFAIGKTLAARIRSGNRRLKDSVRIARAAL